MRILARCGKIPRFFSIDIEPYFMLPQNVRQAAFDDRIKLLDYQHFIEVLHEFQGEVFRERIRRADFYKRYVCP